MSLLLVSGRPAFGTNNVAGRDEHAGDMVLVGAASPDCASSGRVYQGQMRHTGSRQCGLYDLPQSHDHGASIRQGTHPRERGLVDYLRIVIPIEVEIGLFPGIKTNGAERIVQRLPREAAILPVRAHSNGAFG